MDSVDRINNAIQYIEKNLCEDIDYKEISRITLSPISAFQRFFFLSTGIALSDYIRKRRLSCALNDLKNTEKKIIDIAHEYGYESSDAFTNAFKRMYGITPSAARKDGAPQFEPFYRLYFEISIKYIKGEVSVKKIHEMAANINAVEIYEMPEMRLIGRETRCGGSEIIGLKNKANELWEDIIKDGAFETIKSLPSVIPKAMMAWTGNFTSEDGTYSYIIGKFVPFDTPIPKGFTSRVLPETLVAKGIYGEEYSMVDIYKSWGYTNNYDIFGWNAEVVFEDDPDEHDWFNFCAKKQWTNISPVRKIDG